MFIVDFYIANETEAEAVVNAEDKSQWPHFWIKGVGPVEFMELRAILHGVNSDPRLETEGGILYQTDDGGIAIFRLNEEFIEELARIQANEIDKLAETWVGSSESLVRAQASDAAQFLRQLVSFAVQSRSMNTPILTMYVL